MSFSQSVKTKEMEEGEMLEVRWRPDRRCILEYIGKEHFKVIKSENSKLNEGDTFRSAILFWESQPTLTTYNMMENQD